MSDAIKHKCGIAIIRLLKPLSYYKEGSTVILMEMGFFVVVGHFHEADTSSTKFVVEPNNLMQKRIFVIYFTLSASYAIARNSPPRQIGAGCSYH